MIITRYPYGDKHICTCSRDKKRYLHEQVRELIKKYLIIKEKGI